MGGGAGGVEVSMALNHRLKLERQQAGKHDAAQCSVSLFSKGQILQGHTPSARSKFLRLAKVCPPVFVPSFAVGWCWGAESRGGGGDHSIFKPRMLSWTDLGHTLEPDLNSPTACQRSSIIDCLCHRGVCMQQDVCVYVWGVYLKGVCGAE